MKTENNHVTLYFTLMDIQVPEESTFQSSKRKKTRQFLYGLIAGTILFGLNLSRIVLYYGIDEVEWYSWMVSAIGVVAFGLLARWKSGEFWKTLFGLNR